ncbi:regulator of telomere elongation helicase 1 homolog [Periplaneta americana]|uniref:regulator of telomere elongation helicase 1 homolog n=1 Tax=Periplaneta americana TaxID=6978 RepID=UPI0037E8DE0B
MPEYMINGVLVNFPFEPYSVQTAYMEKVIECLKKGVNGMLESPTGTGKTLSLLCSSLGWLSIRKAQRQAEARGLYQLPDGDFVTGLKNSLNDGAGVPQASTSAWSSGGTKIIYASRTHSQLSQAVQELKKTGYKHTRIAVLGSRDQMCIHPEVSQEQNNIAKMHMCQALTKKGACSFFTNLERKKEDPSVQDSGILDIEDLVKAGRKLRVCPYFMARELKTHADVVFMPYNYILDNKHLKNQGIELQGNVVILDEAHNVEKMCEESVSVQIRSTDVALCIQEITEVMKDFAEKEQSATDFTQSSDSSDFTPEELCILKTIFLELEKIIDAIQVTSEGSTFDGDYIISLLAKAEITYEKSDLLIQLLVKVVQYLSVAGNSPFHSKGAGIQKFLDLLRIIYRGSNNYAEQIKRSFKVHITEEEPKSSKNKSISWGETKPSTSNGKGRVMSFLCFSPAFGMKQLMENCVHCIILTSGTLSPMQPLISELGIPIPVTLENPHVIGPNQVYVSVVKAGPDGYPLNSSYQTRSKPEYMASLGNTILNISRVVPHGLLVFFPSYPLLYSCQEKWQQSGLWSRIVNIKPIFVEPRSRDSFTTIIAEYYKKVQDPETRGAIFMGVTRGKVSEGLDFMDVNGRAVIMTGLPYPPMMDIYVKLKRSYLEENRKKTDADKCLTSHQWYLFEASRAVNQAIGRVIRHKDDYGAIIFCDCRFEGPDFRKALSSWVQPHFKVPTNFGMLQNTLRQFFVNAEKTLPPPKINAPACEAKGLTAVPASFDFVVGRSSIVTKNGKGAKIVPDNGINSDWSPAEYMTTPHSNTKEEKGTDLFSALEKPTSVINFNDITTTKSQTSLFKWSHNEEPKAKKMKLKIAPPKITQCSVDIFAVEDNAAKCAKLQSKMSGPSTSGVKDDPSTKNKSEKMAEIGTYLKEVKRSLDPESYQKFTKLTHTYDKTKDFDQLMTSLWDVMIGNDRNFEHLFRGYGRFIQKVHKQKFAEYCSSKFPEQ